MTADWLCVILLCHSLHNDSSDPSFVPLATNVLTHAAAPQWRSEPTSP